MAGGGVNLPSGGPARTGRFAGPGVESRPRVRGRWAPSGARPSLPTVAGGTAFLGDDDGGVHAVDPVTGDVRWRYRHRLHHDDGEPARSSVAALPAVSADTVFVEAGGQVFAHDRRTGEVRWEVPEISAHHPVVAGELLLVVHDLHAVGAYDVTTGGKRWGTEPADELRFGFLATFPAVVGGRVLLTEGLVGNHTHGGLHAFDLGTGAYRWGHHEEVRACGRPGCVGDDVIDAPFHPVHARGLVWVVRGRYCDAGGPPAIELVGFDPADGTPRAALAEPDGAEVGDVFFAAPVFGAELVYCVSGSRVHALDPVSGRPVWSRDLDAPVVGTPLLAGHVVHAAVEGGRLHALDARTGDPRWDLALDEPTGWSARVEGGYDEVAAPITLADGVLYAETDTCVLALG